MMKRILLILFAAALLSLCACHQAAAEGVAQFTLAADGSVQPLSWGITEEEATAVLDASHIVYTRGNNAILLDDAVFMDLHGSIGLRFSEYDGVKTLLADPEPQPRLSAVYITLPDTDRAAVSAAISAILGEMETERIGFWQEGETYGVKRGGALSEEERYWHAKESLLDLLGMENLGKLLPVLDGRSLTQAAYSVYPYVVKIYDSSQISNLPENTILIELDGSGTVEWHIAEGILNG